MLGTFSGTINTIFRPRSQPGVVCLRSIPRAPRRIGGAYFIGVSEYLSKEYPQAHASLEKFVVDYPGSEFTESARGLIDKCNAEVDSTTIKKNRPRQ